MGQIEQVVISGAGIGGLTAALAFAKFGMRVTVCEKAEKFGEVGAGLQISPNAFKVLRALEIDKELQAYAFAPQNASIRDYQSGTYYLKVPLGDQAVSDYGAPYWHLHRADLHKVLVQLCEKAGVTLKLNSEVVRYEQVPHGQGVRVHLADGRQLETDLLIGADGIHSKIRDLMLGLENPLFMKQVAWRGIVPVSNLKVDIKPDACVWVGPNRHFVTYYLRGYEYVNFVAVEERDDWLSESWVEEGNVNQLKAAFSNWHPEVKAILDSVDESFLWALKGRDELPTWFENRVVLLGDSCHPMLPFMAQGAAMAIEDAYVLAKQVSKYPLDEALMRYELERKPRVTRIQNMSQNNAALYHMHGGVLGKIKLNGLRAVSSVVPAVVKSKLDFIYGYNATEK
ncbi:FAD-dependent monooxygenase [Marinomonas sp. C2222]|uniref:FAD-dependent monooxygenase n=1 Tax=Marinomonas sargassi TaxID=2984494 RepID=A0ABT2YP20_9GAMM|nr:FAD-dependent monooxygenase [Marinomonas sargassi]MCV2401581.1 FAD-dependent monooxygenase [Marinomonas sargassi]